VVSMTVRIIGVNTEWFTNDIQAKFISAIQNSGETQSNIYIISVMQVNSTRRVMLSQEIDVQFSAFLPDDSSAKSFSSLLSKNVLNVQFALAGLPPVTVISGPSLSNTLTSSTRPLPNSTPPPANGLGPSTTPPPGPIVAGPQPDTDHGSQGLSVGVTAAVTVGGVVFCALVLLAICVVRM
jgi:hypothetical protein